MSPTSARFTLPLPPPAVLRRFVARLPIEPPSFVLAAVLNRVLLPRLDAAARGELAGRAVELHVTDFAITCRLELAQSAGGAHGFRPARRAGTAALRISAPAAAFWRLAAGEEDPDTLFFERVLVMEGDTEFGLLLKNTLDAIGPLVPAFLRRPAERSVHGR